MLSAQAIPKYAEDIDEFDNEFKIKENLSPDEKAEVSASLEKLKMLVKQNKALTRDDPSYQVRYLTIW